MTTYESLKQHLENIFLLNIINFLTITGSESKATFDDWIKVVSHMHDKGWLYYTKEGKKIVTVVGAYRIKEFDEKNIDIMPDKEEGNILFVNFAASTSSHKKTLKRMLSKHLKANPEIEELIFYTRNNNENLKRIKLKGEKNEGQTKPTSSTTVSSRAKCTA